MTHKRKRLDKYHSKWRDAVDLEESAIGYGFVMGTDRFFECSREDRFVVVNIHKNFFHIGHTVYVPIGRHEGDKPLGPLLREILLQSSQYGNLR